MFQAKGTIGAEAQQSEKAWLGEDFGGEGGAVHKDRSAGVAGEDRSDSDEDR